MSGMNTGGNDSNLDSAQIIMRINMLSIEVNKKIDIIVCNHSLDSMGVSLRDTMTSMTKQMENN
jgi:hypothetical protein